MKIIKALKRNAGQIVMFACYLAMGLGCGLVTAACADRAGMGFAATMALMLLALYGAILLHIILHEAGHMIFGLMTGYRFVSFRIGPFVWQRTAEGKVRFGVSPLAGAAGQCLMSPPDMKDGKMPFVMYNLGGVLVNLILSLICLVTAAAVQNPAADAAAYVFAMVGAVTAVTNGVPMRMGAVDNDGYNILSMKKSPEAVRGLWVQLKAAEQGALGVRLRDMPEEWFALPSRPAMKNSLCAAVGVFRCSRLMDRMEFSGALREMENMLRMDTGMVGLHQASMRMDMVCCELMLGHGREAAEKHIDQMTEKIMKAMKNHIGVIRCEYVTALLGEGDRERAEKLKAQFEKAAEKWPSKADVESEKELIACAQKKSGV